MSRNDSMLLGLCQLQFHINNPDLEDAWDDGYEHGCAEYAESSNPFPKNSQEYHHWQNGWWAGFYNEDTSADQTEVVKTMVIQKTNPKITTKQWFLALLEVFSGILAFFAVYQLVELAL